MEALKNEILPAERQARRLRREEVRPHPERHRRGHQGDGEEQKALDALSSRRDRGGRRPKLAEHQEVAGLEEKNKLLEAALNRPVSVTTPEEKKEDIRQKANKLFNAFARVHASDPRDRPGRIRPGVHQVARGDLEMKALTVNSDPNGGYLTLPEFGGIIETYVYETSPLRRSPASSRSAPTPTSVTDNDQAGWGWVGETQARPDTYTPQLGKLADPGGRDVRHAERVSQKMLDDAYIDVEAWLAGKVSEVFARGEATAFVSGNGVNKPKGFLSYSQAGTSVGHRRPADPAGLFRQRDRLHLRRAGRPAELAEGAVPEQRGLPDSSAPATRCCSGSRTARAARSST